MNITPQVNKSSVALLGLVRIDRERFENGFEL